jgi:N-acetylglucosamine kinase-like BadF-type ATPase
MTYVIAVDAGGTSTRCAIADTSCRCLAYSVGGGGNPVSAGKDAATAACAQAIAAVLSQTGVDATQIVSLVFCMAGGLTSDDLQGIRSHLGDLGVATTPRLAGDLLGNFCSGTWQQDGYVLEAGTGSGALRVEGGRISQTADGLGWLLGDDGSAFWIGARVVRAALADLDHRGPDTALTGLVLSHLGLRRGCGCPVDGRSEPILEALAQLYALRPVELSGFSAMAFAVPEDRVAREIIAGAAAGLANSLRTVIIPGVTGPVVLAGGVLTGNPVFMKQVMGLVRGDLPQATWIPVADGMAGALVLALRQAGVRVNEDQFRTITGTLACLPARRSGQHSGHTHNQEIDR